MIKSYNLDKKFQIIEEMKQSSYNSTLEKSVENLWKAFQQNKKPSTYNDLIFSVQNFSENSIKGFFIEYQYFAAQRIKPALYQSLMIRPLAVSGILFCKDGIVFGKRNKNMTQDSSLWELAPSGGFSKDSMDSETSTKDIAKQIFLEANEELGLNEDIFTSLEPFCLLEDTQSNVFDIGIKLQTNLSKTEIIKSFEACKNQEYTGIIVIPPEEIPSFIASDKHNIVEISQELLKICNLLK